MDGDVVFTRQGAGGSSGIILHDGGDSIPLKSVSLDCIDVSGVASLFVKLDCEGAEGRLSNGFVSIWPRCRLLSQSLARVHHHWCPTLSLKLSSNLKHSILWWSTKILFDESYVYASSSESGSAPASSAVSQKKLNGLASAHDPGRAEARPSGGTCFRMSRIRLVRTTQNSMTHCTRGDYFSWRCDG